MLDAASRARLRTSYPALTLLTQEAFEELCASAAPLDIPRGTVMFEEGGPCRAFPLLIEGSIRVARTAANGREIVLYRVLPGEACVLTSSCLLGRKDYGARGTAETRCIGATLPQAVFDRLIAGHAAFRDYIFALFAERIGELMLLVEAVAFQRLDQRLAALLLGKGRSLDVTHQQLAEELGSVREMVSRILKHFAEDGLVSLGRERIEVLDPGGLRKISA